MKIIYLLLFAAVLTSCGATVAVDYDKQADFSTYNSYNYYPNIDSGLSELDDERIMRVTDSLLQERGFVKTENPSFLINFFARESLSNSQSTIGFGFGSAGGNVGVGVGGGIPIGGRTINQQLTMDFVDFAQDDLVWQAVSDADYKESFSPERKEAYYFSLIEKILSKYPPEKN
ncbi:DUF4136 domain-containing protein [Aequorivita echinoideorum]|uniref:DUF4136 domain-containing protein n=1 Tax=Aequorivita echinoideorum TaxID=1549647 RepID=A0ABS5S2N3_9FLAO|nr:DUF4136 domain-containing protein [Aequorivita echinoideorum]MBT0607459.1 DUF4136 domain-containing protein [Aequorivita echinoideorum]